jgi:hypothetical protein
MTASTTTQAYTTELLSLNVQYLYRYRQPTGIQSGFSPLIRPLISNSSSTSSITTPSITSTSLQFLHNFTASSPLHNFSTSPLHNFITSPLNRFTTSSLHNFSQLLHNIFRYKLLQSTELGWTSGLQAALYSSPICFLPSL